MSTFRSSSQRPALVTMCLLGVLVFACLLWVGGCVVGDYGSFFWVRGTLLDADSLTAVQDAAVGGRTFTDGEETDFVSPLSSLGNPQFPLSTEDGSFVLSLSEGFMGYRPFPRPDRIEVIVVRDGCEQSFMIDINEDTAVDLEDMELWDTGVELKGPILLPPCEE